MKAFKIRNKNIIYYQIDLYDEDFKELIDNKPAINKPVINTKRERSNLMRNIAQTRKDIRFQNWNIGKYHILFNSIPHYAWTINEEFLRYSIENENITELIFDLDCKNEEGNKDLNKSLKEAVAISKKLNREGIKHTVYYSGGGGVHIHSLLDISNLDFLQYSNIDIDINEYEKEFRNKKTNKENTNKINSRNEERKELKRIISEFFEIKDKVDNSLFSTKEMITCEGFRKRDGVNYKIKLPLEKTYNTNELRQFIEIYKDKIIIDDTYLNKVSKINNKIKEYISKRLNIHRERREEKKERENESNSGEDIRRENQTVNKPNEDIIIKHLVTYSYIYNNKGLSSTNKFYTSIVTYLYSATKSEEITKYYLEMLFNEFNCPNNLTCSIDEKINSVVERYKRGYTKIFMCDEYVTKKEFWSVYYMLFLKKSILTNNQTNKVVTV